MNREGQIYVDSEAAQEECIHAWRQILELSSEKEATKWKSRHVSRFASRPTRSAAGPTHKTASAVEKKLVPASCRDARGKAAAFTRPMTTATVIGLVRFKLLLQKASSGASNVRCRLQLSRQDDGKPRPLLR